jgi:hypothetical protein
MSEEENANEPQSGNDIDAALNSLLGDIEKETPIVKSSPRDLPGEAIPETAESNSAVEEAKGPKGRFLPSVAPRRRRKVWPWVLLFLALCGGGGWWTRSHWLPQAQHIVQKWTQKWTHKEEIKTELPPEMPPEIGMPNMDAEFLPPATDTVKGKMAEQLEGEKPATHEVAPPEKQSSEKPAVHGKGKPEMKERVVVQSMPARPKALDSVLIRDISGRLQGKNVQFRCELMLYSSIGGLRAKAEPFEDAIKAVTANIFYFSGSGKTKIPEIELQVLQKAGFLFPEGRLIQVTIQNLQLEPVLP